MTSIYQRVLGADFDRLHPRIQERFGLTSASGRAAIGRGTMDELWHGRFYTLPFLYLGTWRNIMFPERGSNVPFKIENWAYLSLSNTTTDVMPDTSHGSGFKGHPG